MIKKLLFGITTLLFLFSCSSDDGSNTETLNTNGTKLVRGTFVSNNGITFTSRYVYDGNHLVKTIQDDVTNVFVYTGERIVRVDNYTNGNTLSSTVVFDYNSDGKLIKSSSTSLTGEPIYYVYTYNSDESVTVVKYFGGELPENIKNTGQLYFENGELVKKVMSMVGNPTITYHYTYDDKNNPRSNNPGYYAIFLYSDWGEAAIGNQHNLLSVSSDSNSYSYQYQYEYNLYGYPMKATRIDSNGNLMDGLNMYFYE